MKVRVLSHVCRGHAMCAMACPEIFVSDEITGHATVSREVVPPHLQAAVRNAQLSCPEQAIEISSDE